MFVELQRVLANIPKIHKSYFWKKFNIWIKKSQMDEYPKYYWE